MSESIERPRILVLGDAAVPTGFARVVEGIFRPLARAYEIHHLGTHYLGDPHSYDWKVYPAGLGGDVWGVNRLASLVERIKPALRHLCHQRHLGSARVHESASGLGGRAARRRLLPRRRRPGRRREHRTARGRRALCRLH